MKAREYPLTTALQLLLLVLVLLQTVRVILES